MREIGGGDENAAKRRGGTVNMRVNAVIPGIETEAVEAIVPYFTKKLRSIRPVIGKDFKFTPQIYRKITGSEILMRAVGDRQIIPGAVKISGFTE